MARRYEYVIHGPPPATGSPTISPRKTLSTRKDQRRTSNLRSLYRDSGDTIVPIQYDEESMPYEQRASSPTTPRLPLTPPTAGEEDKGQEDFIERAYLADHSDAIRLRSIPATPVNGNSPLTPDDTPPRELLKPTNRPLLNLRPSIASTRAESFRTAKEQIYPDDESIHTSPEVVCSFETLPPVPKLPNLSSMLSSGDSRGHLADAKALNGEHINIDHLSSPIPPNPDQAHQMNTTDEEQNTSEPQFTSDDVPQTPDIVRSVDRQAEDLADVQPSVHAQVTTTPSTTLTREKSLRNRLEETNKLQTSASTEAFANVIGWNDGVVPKNVPEEPSTNRWSTGSNLSAVEAYVVDSPVKPRKRGTLRKVLKNDSLRSVSSPIPKSNRNSIQSTSESPHRLVHKTQKLGNQNRWSTGSEISKRSLSWGSGPMMAKHEVIKVAVIPERQSSLNNSLSSSRRHSRSLSTNSGMPPVTPIGPRRKRAFSDSQSQDTSPESIPRIPLRSTSLSAPTSRSGSRANSIASHQVSFQREQAEKDLRFTLDRMESERLSASLRRGSDQSATSPSPASKEEQQTQESIKYGNQTKEAEDALEHAEKPKRTKRHSIDIVNITPGSREWADLRPSELVGTPFSQASGMSASPEIIEARIINFFPHNNDSVQLIEPNRLSETPAVKALKAQNIRRANTVPERQVKISTPKEKESVFAVESSTVDSPLRNPRKPPEPPQVQFAVIPPTPKSETKKQIDNPSAPDINQIQTGSMLRKRPLLQTNERSESFIRTLSRGLSLRNAKNLKADQELDSTLHPFWRPRAFWDEDEQKRRSQAESEGDVLPPAANDDNADVLAARSTTILDPNQPLVRSNSIATGPMALVRKFSERRKQRRIVDDHIAQQQALVKQTSYSSLHRIRAGHRLFGLQPLRSFSLNTRNVNLTRLNSLRDRVTTARARRENEKREVRREKLRKSIGTDVVSQGDSRFPAVDMDSPMVIEHLGGRKVEDANIINEMLENARAENVVEKRGLRM